MKYFRYCFQLIITNFSSDSPGWKVRNWSQSDMKIHCPWTIYINFHINMKVLNTKYTLFLSYCKWKFLYFFTRPWCFFFFLPKIWQKDESKSFGHINRNFNTWIWLLLSLNIFDIQNENIKKLINHFSLPFNQTDENMYRYLDK